MPHLLPQAVDHATRDTTIEEEKEDPIAEASTSVKQKHGMEVMMRVGALGVGVGIGYHYSVTMKVEAKVNLNKLVEEAAEYLSKPRASFEGIEMTTVDHKTWLEKRKEKVKKRLARSVKSAMREEIKAAKGCTKTVLEATNAFGGSDTTGTSTTGTTGTSSDMTPCDLKVIEDIDKDELFPDTIENIIKADAATAALFE